MMSLNQFIAHVKDGVAKNNHFAVNLTLPSALATMKEINMNKVILFCDQTSLPGISFGTAQIRSYGEFREVPYEKLYEPITLSFYVDSKITVKYLFDKWVQLIQSPVSRDFNYPKQYQTNSIEIFVLNSESDFVYSCKLFNCYPKAVAPIQLDYAGKDVMKLSVTMIYEYYQTHLLSTRKNTDTSEILVREPVMQEYSYGYDLITVIPESYYDDFARFQNEYGNYDPITGAIESISRVENVGEFTGYGGIFK